jgi:hypothetical protein
MLMAMAQKQAESGHIIQRVKVPDLDRVWKWIDQLLDDEPDLWNKGHTKQSLRLLCEEGVFSLWLVVKDEMIVMAFMTTYTNFPRCQTIDIVWAKGKKHTLEDFLALVLSAVERVGMHAGCKYCTIQGRQGFKPMIAPFGYEVDRTVYFKEIATSEIH